ncbi:MAG: hypothetical protein CMF69_12130 [Magnetovibrio sp.]|nr:hypothetical protein [Magnetovibrio sp.]
MLQVSLSEIETSICKAVSATSLPVSFGEDAGRAARCMAESGIGSLVAFVEALDALNNGQSTGFNTQCAAMGKFIPKLDARHLSALYAGPSACDLLVSTHDVGPEYAAITLENVDKPLIILFESLVTSIDRTFGLHLSWKTQHSIQAICWRGALTIVEGSSQNLCTSGPAKMSILRITKPPTNMEPAWSPQRTKKLTYVEEEVWHRLISYTNRLLVDSTEKSRLTGAGAGITDTD